MKKFLILLLSVVFFGFGVTGAGAYIVLYESTFNVNSQQYTPVSQDIYSPSVIVPGLNDDSFNWDTGLGSLTLTMSLLGDNGFVAFFDHEIYESKSTYFNEYGESYGTVALGQSFEIDEPGYRAGNDGNIDFNVMIGALDGVNSVTSTSADDTSMALGWNFTLEVDQSATIDLILSETAPLDGFYLSHTDPGLDPAGNRIHDAVTIYFSSTLSIEDTGTGDPDPDPIPEPGTTILVGVGLAGLFGFGRKKLRKAG